MGQTRTAQRRLLAGIALLLVLLGLLVVALDWRDIRKVVGAANWMLVPLALLFSAISYTCMSYGFAVVNRLFGLEVGMQELAKIGFVSQVLNHLLSSGGAAGYSLRLLTMRNRAKAQEIIAASLFHSYLTTLGMLALLPVGLAYLFFRHPLPKASTAAIGVAALGLMGVFALATLLVFARSFRTRFLGVVGRLGKVVTRHDMNSPLREFDAATSRGVTEFRRRPERIMLVASLVAADWASSAIALAYCFDALGDPLKIGPLITGFALGVSAGVVSMIPGGLGIQEGSMAGIYAVLGVPFQQAVLAAVLFRIVYYFVPYLVSLAFYRRLVRTAAE